MVITGYVPASRTSTGSAAVGEPGARGPRPGPPAWPRGPGWDRQRGSGGERRRDAAGPARRTAPRRRRRAPTCGGRSRGLRRRPGRGGGVRVRRRRASSTPVRRRGDRVSGRPVPRRRRRHTRARDDDGDQRQRRRSSSRPAATGDLATSRRPTARWCVAGRPAGDRQRPWSAGIGSGAPARSVGAEVPTRRGLQPVGPVAGQRPPSRRRCTGRTPGRSARRAVDRPGGRPIGGAAPAPTARAGRKATKQASTPKNSIFTVVHSPMLNSSPTMITG